MYWRTLENNLKTTWKDWFGLSMFVFFFLLAVWGEGKFKRKSSFLPFYVGTSSSSWIDEILSHLIQPTSSQGSGVAEYGNMFHVDGNEWANEAPDTPQLERQSSSSVWRTLHLPILGNAFKNLILTSLEARCSYSALQTSCLYAQSKSQFVLGQ